MVKKPEKRPGCVFLLGTLAREQTVIGFELTEQLTNTKVFYVRALQLLRSWERREGSEYTDDDIQQTSKP